MTVGVPIILLHGTLGEMTKTVASLLVATMDCALVALFLAEVVGHMTSEIPTPYVQPNLRTTGNWHASMESLPVSSHVLIEVDPEHCASFARSESDTLIGTAALDELAPSLILRYLKKRKIGL